MGKESQGDKSVMFDKFVQWFNDMTVRDNPDNDKPEILQYVETYAMPLFEFAMVEFKFTTKEEMEKSKQESLGDVKKKMLSN